MKYKITYRNGNTKIVDTNSIKDSMFTVSYVQNGVNQVIGVKANSKNEAKEKFLNYKKSKGKQVEFVGIREGFENKPGMPVIDNSGCNIEDGWSGMYNGYIFSYDSKSNKFVITTPNNKYIKISGDLNPKQVIDDIIAGKQVIK